MIIDVKNNLLPDNFLSRSLNGPEDSIEKLVNMYPNKFSSLQRKIANFNLRKTI